MWIKRRKCLGSKRQSNDRRSNPKRGRFLLLLFLGLLGSLYYLVASSLLTQAREKHQFNAQQTSAQQSAPLLSSPIAHQSAVQVLHEPLPATAVVTSLYKQDKDGNQILEHCDRVMVTGYFPVRSKHAAGVYLEWIPNLLSVQDCMVIFSTPSMTADLTAWRQPHGVGRTVIVTLPTVADLPIAHLQGLTNPSTASSSNAFWQHQLDLDYERRHHKSYEVFWIWLSKSWCVRIAIAHNFFQTDLESAHNVFMWQDIGSFRRKAWYYGKTIIQHPDLIPAGTILWMAHHPPNPPPTALWNDKKNNFQHYFHSGSQGAGSAVAWRTFHQRFAETVDLFVQRDMFIGEDQCVLQSTCQRFPDLCAYVRSEDIADNNYFGLRYAVYRGRNNAGEAFHLWRMPGATVDS